MFLPLSTSRRALKWAAHGEWVRSTPPPTLRLASGQNTHRRISGSQLFDTDQHRQALLAQYSSASFSSCSRRV